MKKNDVPERSDRLGKLSAAQFAILMVLAVAFQYTMHLYVTEFRNVSTEAFMHYEPRSRENRTSVQKPGLQDIKGYAERYLFTKYGRRFTAEDYKAASEDDPDIKWIVRAHANDAPELRVYIAVSVDEQDNISGSDDYLESKRNYEGMQAIEADLQQIYGNTVHVKYDIYTSHADLDNLTYAELVKARPDDLGMYLELSVFTDEPLDRQTEAQKLFQVYQKWIEPNPPPYWEIYVSYYSANTQADFLKRLENPSMQSSSDYSDAELDEMRSGGAWRLSADIYSSQRYSNPEDVFNKAYEYFDTF